MLAASRRPVALTGAGVSAESGLSTFRGPGGLWNERRPEEIATPEAFAADPALVWSFYRWRRERVRACAPNAAHHALAAFEAAHEGFVLITQNVDGYHGAAGSRAVIELHGNLMTDRCSECFAERPADPERDGAEALPRCACGGLERPAVVWFGEPVTRIEEAFAVAGEADVFLVAGTSAQVEPAASAARVAKRAGATVIEVNPEATPLTSIADGTFRGPAAALLPALLGDVL
ncbi:MAG: NAD-dependent deacetylase [Planctomycetota bacterium JB042]